MLPDRVSNPGPLTYESGALLIALCGPACFLDFRQVVHSIQIKIMVIFIVLNSDHIDYSETTNVADNNKRS